MKVNVLRRTLLTPGGLRYIGVILYIWGFRCLVHHNVMKQVTYRFLSPGISIMVHWQRSLDMKLPTDSTIEVFFQVKDSAGIKVFRRHETEYIKLNEHETYTLRIARKILEQTRSISVEKGENRL